MADQVKNARWSDEELFSEEEDDSDDANHSKLLENISVIGGKRKFERRDEPALTISEFNLSSNAHVDPRELLSGLKKHKGITRLHQRLTKIENKTEHVSTPVPVFEKNKIKRKVAYREATAQVSKWQPIVNEHRKADHLNFPVQVEVPDRPTLNSKVDSFKPVTELETTIATLLGNSEHVIPNDKGLSDAEKKALLKMNLTEARERMRELRRMRTLMSYHEQKCRRIKRIKSKRFRKILRKKKEKEQQDVDEKSLMKIDRIRAKERATLKHSSKSKWAKEQLSRKHRDSMTRQALTDQNRLKEELKQRSQDYENSSESEDENDLLAEVADELVEQENEEDMTEYTDSNGWLSSRQPDTDPNPVLLLDSTVQQLHVGKPARRLSLHGDKSVHVKNAKIQKKRVSFQTNTENRRSQSCKDGPNNIDTSEFLLTEPVEEEDTDLQQASRQLLAVQEAFAADDVVDEFMTEKKKLEDESKPKLVDLTLPGWGHWGGLGTKRSTKKRVIKYEPGKVRKDSEMKFVIINDQRDKKLAKHLVSELPYPFSKEEQFNHTLATPIGRHWNTETTFNDRIRPRVSTAIGAVIKPYKLTQDVEQFMKKTASDQAKEREKKKKKKNNNNNVVI